MPGEAVLIAAYSARVLAEAARRSGFRPFVADVFGDDDTRAAAEHYCPIAGARESGIRAKPLFAALEALHEKARAKPLGLALGSGFEDKPRLMALLDARFGLIGTPPAVAAKVKDPLALATLLEARAIPHPETRRDPPETMSGWLSKHQGGAGGAHIRHASSRDLGRRRRYFQRNIPGESYSILCLIAPDHRHMWLSRQWVSPCPAAPFRYGGAVTVPTAPHMAEMHRYASALIDALEFRGLVSFDFRLTPDAAYLLEINPRPGATLDNFDTPTTRLFAAHVDAHRLGTFDPPRPFEGAVANAILYARAAGLTMPPMDWPDWASDRTPPGVPVAPFEPVASVRARADTPDAACERVHARLARLEDLIYESIKS